MSGALVEQVASEHGFGSEREDWPGREGGEGEGMHRVEAWHLPGAGDAREQGRGTRVAGEVAEGIRQFVHQAEEPGDYSLGNEKPPGGLGVDNRRVRWRTDWRSGYALTRPGSKTEAQQRQVCGFGTVFPSEVTKQLKCLLHMEIC